MPAERVEMRRVREILIYRFEQGLGHMPSEGADFVIEACFELDLL